MQVLQPYRPGGMHGVDLLRHRHRAFVQHDTGIGQAEHDGDKQRSVVHVLLDGTGPSRVVTKSDKSPTWSIG